MENVEAFLIDNCFIRKAEYLGCSSNTDDFYIEGSSGHFYSFKSKKFDSFVWTNEDSRTLNECLKILGYKLYD